MTVHMDGGLERHPSGRASVTPVVRDRADLALLRLLARDARMSRRHLARQVGMSPSAVAERINRLVSDGVIRAYRVEIDRARLGWPLIVYVGAVVVQGTDQPRVVDDLRTIPEIEDVHIVTGPKDLLMRLRVRDTDHLRRTLFERIWSVPGVERTETYISLVDMERKDFDVDLLDSILVMNEDADGPDDGGKGNV